MSRPANPKELFNLQHASACNVIEHTFGVFKAHYKILDAGPSYPFKVQAQLVAGLSVVHNFIGIHDPSDTHNVQKSLDKDQLCCGRNYPEPVLLERMAPGITRAEKAQADAFWDQLVEQMWMDYQRELEDHHG